MFFLVGLSLMRAEWVFGSTLCALALSAVEDSQVWARRGLSLCLVGLMGMALLSAWLSSQSGR